MIYISQSFVPDLFKYNLGTTNISYDYHSGKKKKKRKKEEINKDKNI